jgi:hypothetical protein
MTLLRRRPREIYRVYSEEEYLGGAGSELGAGTESASAGTHRLHRIVGVAVLVGATGMVGAVVALNSGWAHTSAGRGAEKLLAVTRSRVVRSPVVTASHGAPSQPVAVRQSKATHPLLRRAWHHHHGGSGLRPLIHLSAQPRKSVAIVADYVPRPPSDEASGTSAEAPGASVSTQAGTTTAAVSAPPAHPAPETRAEFGFER